MSKFETLFSIQKLTLCTLRGVLPEGKGDRCVRLTTLPPSCAVVMKSGNLNFLEPSGPLQACNGTALSAFTLRVNYNHKDFQELMAASNLYFA